MSTAPPVPRHWPWPLFQTLGVLLGLGLLYVVRDAVFLLLIAALFAAALYPLIEHFHRRGIPRHLGITVILIGLVLLLLITLTALGSLFISEGRMLMAQLPESTRAALSALERIPYLKGQYGTLNTLSGYLGTLLNHVITALFSSLTYLVSLFHGILSLLMIGVLVFFLLADAAYFEASVLRIFPKSARPQARRFVRTLAKQVGRYVRGQIVVLSITGSLTWLGLSLIGVPYAFILGLLIALLDIIPVIGPMTAASFGILVALGEQPTLALWAAGVYFTVQQLESYVLYPLILGKSAGLHPLWILLSILIGGLLFQVPGIILAVPTAITLRLLLEWFYLPKMDQA